MTEKPNKIRLFSLCEHVGCSINKAGRNGATNTITALEHSEPIREVRHMSHHGQYGDSRPQGKHEHCENWRSVGRAALEPFMRGIYARAVWSARRAVAEFEQANGDIGPSGYGFAVVSDRAAADIFRRVGADVDDAGAVYNPGSSRFQSLACQEVGCRAFAAVMAQFGVSAHVSGRMD